MPELISKIFKKYLEFISRIFTFVGLTLMYTIGISIGFLIFKMKKDNNQKKYWYKFNQNFNPNDMY
jgi:hypothetical protein